MLKQIFLTILLVCFNLRCSSSERTPNGDYYNEFIREYAFFFILPNLDLNQFCPPTDQIPILEPGTYTRFMAEGDTYLFDNRARFQQSAPAGEERLFTFVIQENPGQEVKLTTPKCGTSPIEFKADDDSGLPGQLENVFISLQTPPLPPQRSDFFIKLTTIFGKGTITFTTPTSPDPKNAH
ncbi:LIC_10705 family lipoprotein [Leptospira alexanderi]|uniref:LIC_10705 family lipoprotein n=2 Tax=Leptospira alexanderi TaxID=100053 RepID=UPI00099125C0|nr:LIC_10705 family lipoprotein [Leptospira alexanderi]